jgi:hypothetical protein
MPKQEFLGRNYDASKSLYDEARYNSKLTIIQFSDQFQWIIYTSTDTGC